MVIGVEAYRIGLLVLHIEQITYFFCILIVLSSPSCNFVRFVYSEMILYNCTNNIHALVIQPKFHMKNEKRQILEVINSRVVVKEDNECELYAGI